MFGGGGRAGGGGGETGSGGSAVELAAVGGEGVVGHLPWGSTVLPERKPHWVRWKAGEWLLLLERVAADRQAVRWGRLVGCVARSSSSSALDGRGGGRV